MTQKPKFTVENATDWRTPSGIRVIEAEGQFAHSAVAKFETPFDPWTDDGVPCDDYAPDWVVDGTGRIPGLTTQLIYDPLPKDTYVVSSPLTSRGSSTFVNLADAIECAKKWSGAQLGRPMYISKLMVKVTASQTVDHAVECV